MKSKRILIVLFLIVLVGYFSYKYVYQEHRDISSEEASYTLTVEDLDSAFQRNENSANEKYLDKTILIKGKLSSSNLEEKNVVIDSKITCYFSELPKKIDSTLLIKGRFIGYDELLDEYKINECSFVEN